MEKIKVVEHEIGSLVRYPSGSGELALAKDASGICIVIESGVYKRVDYSSLMSANEVTEARLNHVYEVFKIMIS